MIRTFLPFDLAAMLLQSRSLPNKAKIKSNIDGEESRFLTLANLLGQSLHPRLRKSLWVWANGLRLRGLASARDRSSTHAWEIDRLLLEEGDEECCQLLLKQLSFAGLQSGVEKIFLRLPTDNPFVNSAQKAGFRPYVTELLYGLDAEKRTGYDYTSSLVPRHKQIGDDYRLFELYQNCTPAPVRRFEGMTFSEWQKTKDRMAKREWVFEQDGNLTGWLRLEGKGGIGQFELMACKEEYQEQILTQSLILLDSYGNLLCLASEYQGELLRLLQNHGFAEITSFSVLVKELTAKTQEPCLIPIGA